MALFNKKKSQDAAAPAPAVVTSAGTGDDFSDFSPEALAGAAGPEDTGKKKKGKKAADDKRGGNGRGIKPGTALGLNIGSDSIKVVEATATGNAVSVTAIGIVPTPEDSIANGVVMSANALVLGIRDALAQAGIKSKKVVTSISGTGALVVRIIEVPKMSDGELLDNMKMDADRYIPFPPSEVEMDFKALRELPSDPDSPNMEVLLAAAQREIVDQHVQVIQDAKLDPRSIDVEPLAAARALTHPLTSQAPNGPAALGSDPDYGDVSAILNIGASGTEISILRGDILVFTRTVPSGGNAMTQALVDTLGLSWSDAEQLKQEKGDALAPTVGTGPVAAAAGGDDDWSAFGEDAVAGNAPQTDDPFDDEFFEQGPINTQPGEQHQQKESGDQPSRGKDDAADEKPPVVPEAFFDFGDETEPEEKMPSIGQGRPTSFEDLLGEEEESLSDLPSLTPEAASAMPMASAFDFPEEGVDEDDVDAKLGEAVSQLPTIQGAPAATEVVGSTRVEPEDEALLPSEQPAAFSFSFDEAPAAADAQLPAAAPAPQEPAAGFSFGFEEPATPPEPAPAPPAEPDDPFAAFMASAGEEAAAAPAPTAAPTEPVAADSGDDELDLDSLFGDNTSGGTAASAVTAPADDALDLGDFGLGGVGGATDFSADLSGFGAGLGGASAGEIDEATLYHALKPVLDTLVSEVRRSLEYHTSRYPDAAVQRVMIVGGGAKLKNLDVYLTQELGLPAVVSNPIAQLNIKAPQLPPGYVEENGTLFTVALGLAMRELTK